MTALDILRLKAPEFADTDDETAEKWIELTEPYISRRIFGRFYEEALALLTAHKMKLAGLGENALGTVGDSIRVSSYHEGETSVSFGGAAVTGQSSDTELALTAYGLQFRSIRDMVVISIRVSGEA